MRTVVAGRHRDSRDKAGRARTASPPIWTVPEVGALPDDDHGRLVRRGRDLITATYAHIERSPDPAKRFAGNNLACSNCHLQAGAKKFGLPIFGLVELFSAIQCPPGAEITIEDRVNACMSRSLNGRALPLDSPEMQAFVAYIRFLSTGVPAGKVLSGLGAGSMPELDRAADPVRGKAIYANACLSCRCRWLRNPPQPADRRSRLHGPAAVGSGQFQQWRRHGPADHRGELRALQHAARNGLPEPAPVEQAWDVAAYMISTASGKSRPRQGFPRP